MGSPTAFNLVRWRVPSTATPSGFLVPLLGGLCLVFSAAHGQSAALATPDPAPTAPEQKQLPDGEIKPSDSHSDAAVFESISREVGGIFAKCKDAVVRIQGCDRYGQHAGTGFFIDPAGTIYTHYAVAGRSWNLTVEFASKRYPAECLLADPRSGVALLRIQAAPTPFLPIGNSQELRVASPVVTIGYPMDLPASPSFGLVAGLDQKFDGSYLATTHIHANVPVQSGEQGSPMLDSSGKVVGILDCRLDYGASCLALPIQAAEKVRADYLRFGEARPGWIGVTVQPVGDDPDGEVQVAQLAEDTPAAHSGLQPGDILVRVGTTPIHRFGDLRDASFYLTADEMVPITVRRGNEQITVRARAVDPPDAIVPLPHPPKDIFNGSPRVALPNARQ
jgi:serine protease Do